MLIALSLGLQLFYFLSSCFWQVYVQDILFWCSHYDGYSVLFDSKLKFWNSAIIAIQNRTKLINNMLLILFKKCFVFNYSIVISLSQIVLRDTSSFCRIWFMESKMSIITNEQFDADLGTLQPSTFRRIVIGILTRYCMEVTGNGCKSCVIRCTLESLRNNASGLGLCCYCLSKLGKSKHQEPLIRSESNRAAGLSSCVDCADHRKARRSCQIANRSIVVFTTNSRLHRCV